jgi:hypothetical protein
MTAPFANTTQRHSDAAGAFVRVAAPARGRRR